MISDWRSVLLLGLSTALLSGCSVGKRIAVAQMVPIVENTVEAARQSSDLELIGEALPGNVLLIEGLIRTHPKNQRLLTLGAFTNFGYALGFVEGEDTRRAAKYYLRGKQLGWRALQENRKFRRGQKGGLDQYKTALEKLGRKDGLAMVWTAANWGRWLSLNLESIAAIAEQPMFEALLGRLLEVEPEIEDGLPHVLMGMYLALRPKMFGGNLELSSEHFHQAFEISERKNLLYLVFYAESYCRQSLDEEAFDQVLEEVLASSVDHMDSDFVLMNAIAKKRAEKIKALKDEWF